jgi:hypothetical protein
MEEAMGNVEPHLVVDGRSEFPRLPPRRLGADKDLAVLKGDHIGRPRFVKEAPMQFRHAAVGNEHNAHFIERREHVPFGAAQLQALPQGAFRENLQRTQLERNFSLPIEHGDFWDPLIHEEMNRGLRG